MVQDLDGRGGQADPAHGLDRRLGQETGRPRRAGIGLGDDRIAGRQGGREIAAADGVEGEGEVVGAEDRDGAPERGKPGADAEPGVDRGAAPGPVATGRGGLAELGGRSRQFHRPEPGLGREPGLALGRFDERVRALLETFGHPVEEGGDPVRTGMGEKGGRLGPGGERVLEVGPGGDGILARDPVPGRRIDGAEDARGFARLAPAAGDEDPRSPHPPE